MKKNTKLIIGKNFKSRNHISFRIYNEGKIKIGDNCFFNDGCSINCQEKIIIGNNVMFGQNVMIFDHDHDYKNNIDEFIRKSIILILCEKGGERNMKTQEEYFNDLKKIHH